MTDLVLRAGLLAGLALALAACSPSNGAPDKGGHKGGPGAGMPPPEVTVVTVAPQALPVTFEYVGQTAGSREVEVRARVAGILLKRNFTEGAPVRQGQSLYTVDPAPFEAAVARAEADVGAAEARLEQARKNAARLKPRYAEQTAACTRKPGGSTSPTCASRPPPARARRAPSFPTPAARSSPASSCASSCAARRAPTRSPCRSAPFWKGRRGNSCTW